jgi:S1-C subfamily serine protease
MASLLLSCCGCAGQPSPESHVKPSITDHATVQGQDPVARSQLTPDVIFALASPAVVQVVAPDHRPGGGVSCGSGFLVAESLVATNHHVIADADAVTIILSDKTELPVVGIAAMDRDADLAILKVSRRLKVRPLALSATDLPPFGSKVFAIGNPLGQFANTLSDGLVSGHRERGAVPDFPEKPTLLQVSAPISHGSSGGPLVGADGNVVGVMTLTWEDEGGRNINFAVPASHVARLVLQCDDESLTKFPLARKAITKGPNVAYKWSPEDVESAVHFVRAYRAADAAWALCRQPDPPWQPGDPPEIVNGNKPSGIARVGRPCLLAPKALAEFSRLMAEASREGSLVRKDVLRRIHPRMPDAFEDFILATRYIATHAHLSRPDPRYAEMWRRWSDFRTTSRADVHIPKEALSKSNGQ